MDWIALAVYFYLLVASFIAGRTIGEEKESSAVKRVVISLISIGWVGYFPYLLFRRPNVDCAICGKHYRIPSVLFYIPLPGKVGGSKTRLRFGTWFHHMTQEYCRDNYYKKVKYMYPDAPATLVWRWWEPKDKSDNQK